MRPPELSESSKSPVKQALAILIFAALLAPALVLVSTTQVEIVAASPDNYDPILVGSLQDNENLEYVWWPVVVENYAYVTTMHPTGDDNGYFVVFDVENAESPSIVAVLKNENLKDAHEVDIKDNYAYVATGEMDRLVVIDISTPSSPSIAAVLYDGVQLDDLAGVFIVENYAYTTSHAGDRLTIINISDPLNPSITGSVYHETYLDYAYSVWVQGEYAYVTSQSSHYFTVVDVSNPAFPRIVAYLEGITQARHLTVSGNYAYVNSALGGDKVWTIDISDPTSPSLKDSIVTYDAVGIEICGDHVYTGTCYYPSGPNIYVIDVENAADISQVGSITDSRLDYIEGMFIKGKYLYVGSFSDNRFAILEMQDMVLTSPVLVSPDNEWSTSTDNTPTFIWRRVCADNHWLIIDNDSDFSSPIENKRIRRGSYTVVDVLPPDNYWWKVIAENSTTENTSEIRTFEVVVADLSNWQYRKEITIDSAKVNDNLVNFPVLISLTDNDLRDHAMDNGDDIIFVPSSVPWSSGTTVSRYDYEIENYDNSDGGLTAWVRLPNLYDNENVSFYIYYGYSGTSNWEDAEGVWGNNYLMVQHMKDITTSSIEDSTSYNNDGTKTGADEPKENDGKIYKAQDFDGSNDYISEGLGVIDYNQAWTLSYWIKTDDGGIYTDYGGSVQTPVLGTVSGSIVFSEGIDNSKVTYKYYSAGWQTVQGTENVADNEWHRLTLVHNGSQEIDVFVDSTDDITDGASFTTSTYKYRFEDIGRSYGVSYPDAIIDEIRLSNVARDNDWITTAFNNENDPSTFYSVGDEETPEVGVYPTQPTLYLPLDGSTIYDDTPRFEWTKGENADNHRLLVDNDSDFSSPDENRILVADNYYTIADENALSRDNYSWKVISVNENGENESPVWTFLNYLTPRVIWSYHDPSGYAVGVGMATDASSMAGGTELSDKLYFWGSDNDNVPEWEYTNPGGTDAKYVEMSDDGRYIVATFQGSIRFFENSSSTPIWSYTGLGTDPYADISADGTRIVGSDGGDVWLWGNSDNTPIWSYKQGTYSSGAHVSADGNYVIAVIENYIIKFTDSDNTPVWTYDLEDQAGAATTTISDNGDYAAVATAVGYGGYLYLFGNDNSPIWTYNLDGNPLTPYGLDISSSGHRIAATIGNLIKVFTNQDNVETFSWNVGAPIRSADIHDSGEYLAVGSGTFSPSEIGHFWFFGVVENVLYNKYDLESLGWDLKLSDNATRSFASSDHTRKFFYFETDFSAPGQPTPVSPENDTQIFDNTPTFEWTRGTGATSHRLLIDNDSNFSSTNENRTFVVENSYTIPSENSLPSDNYFWKVIAVNALGENESVVFEFELISRAWELIETWTGTLQVPAAWELIETWSGTVEAYATWDLIETWTSVVEAYAAWELIETWSGTVEAFAQWELIETWTGTVQTPSAWGLIEQWTGMVEAFAEWTLIETWTGTIEAFSGWQLLETWTGTVEAFAEWQLVETWSGTIQTPSVPMWNLIETWIGAVQSPAEWQLIETWIGTVSAPVAWILIETWTGTIEAPVAWQLISTWSGTVQAPSAWDLLETWTGTIQAYAEWSEVENWTGTVYAFGWRLIETWDGTVHGVGWRLIETWTGSIETPAVFAVSVSITPAENSGTLGDTLTYTVMVVNIGGTIDNYDLASSDAQGWATYLDNDNFIDVPSGENRETTLNVGLSTIGTHEVIVTATGTGVSDSDNCTAISLSKYVPPPGGTIGGEFVALGVAMISIGLAIALAFLFAQRREEE